MERVRNIRKKERQKERQKRTWKEKGGKREERSKWGQKERSKENQKGKQKWKGGGRGRALISQLDLNGGRRKKGMKGRKWVNMEKIIYNSEREKLNMRIKGKVNEQKEQAWKR